MANGTLTLVAEFQAKPSHETRLLDELNAMISPSEAEPGCLAYRPLVDPNTPGAMVIIEQWQDEAALQHHFTTDHFRHVAAILDEILAEPFKLRRLTSNDDTGPHA
jgi:quinol monooxygenase YgiN